MKYLVIIVVAVIVTIGINYIANSKSTNVVLSNNLQAESGIDLPSKYDRDDIALIMLSSLVESNRSFGSSDANSPHNFVSYSYRLADEFVDTYEKRSSIYKPVQIAPKPIVNAGFKVK